MEFCNNLTSKTAMDYDSASHEKVETFRRDLQESLQAYLPSRGPGYTRVVVVLVVWENASSYTEELQLLGDLFKTHFGYEIEWARVPISNIVASKDRKANRYLLITLANISNNLQKQDLMIVYYCGHGEHEWDKESAGNANRSLVIR
jgi:hypothetical protein